jgi:hypothetical protein
MLGLPAKKTGRRVGRAGLAATEVVSRPPA